MVLVQEAFWPIGCTLRATKMGPLKLGLDNNIVSKPDVGDLNIVQCGMTASFMQVLKSIRVRHCPVLLLNSQEIR